MVVTKPEGDTVQDLVDSDVYYTHLTVAKPKTTKFTHRMPTSGYKRKPHGKAGQQGGGVALNILQNSLTKIADAFLLNYKKVDKIMAPALLRPKINKQTTSEESFSFSKS